MTPDNAANRREADALAAGIAEEIRADLYVSRREYLHGKRNVSFKNARICTPEEAVSIVGLYLRQQGVFIYFRGTDGKFEFRCNEGLYFLTGALELIPAVWRWSSGCAQFATSVGDTSLAALSSSLLQRVQRALQARDDLCASLNLNQTSDTAEAALSSLDSALVFLMGAVDVSARVAHHVLGVPGSPHRAGWQYVDPSDPRKWVERVRASAPRLAALVDSGTEGYHTLTVLRRLRNSVHGEAMKSLVRKDGRKAPQTLTGLPQQDLQEILDSMDVLGGRDSWGIDSTQPGFIHADPGILLEKILENILRLLDGIMLETPVERLPGVHLTAALCAPPADPHGRFSEMKRLGIRWQLGL
ncbi:hypothetical protein ACIRBZ_47330 [Streptomyces sp. NPDC094038]|uniref:hypothetical protein n=1 Tax=Streptomyces sp. NPDC094038 TaxID=3366055 RepID=UPI0038102158